MHSDLAVLTERKMTFNFSSSCGVQVLDKKLKDTKGGYAQFLRENVGEAKVMEEKEKRVKVLEQSTVKAKSKVSMLHYHQVLDATGPLLPVSRHVANTLMLKSVSHIPVSMC